MLVSCAVNGGTWRVLVDTGTDECWPALKQRLQLRFKYRNERTEDWGASALRERYGYSVVLPADTKRGAVVVAGAASTRASPPRANRG